MCQGVFQGPKHSKKDLNWNQEVRLLALKFLFIFNYGKIHIT